MFLQAHPDPVLLSMLVPYIISGLGLLLAAYVHYRNQSREDGQTTPQRLIKLTDGIKTNADDIKSGNTERAALRSNHQRLRTEHDHLSTAVRQLEEKLHLVQVASSRNEAAAEAAKETLSRIDGQLSRLIDTFLTRS